VLHVVDVAHPSWEEQLAVGDEVLEELGVERERTLVVLNKVDLLPALQPTWLPAGRPSVAVSAATGHGLERLVNLVRQALLSAPGVTFLRVPLDQADAVQRAVRLPHRLAQRFDDRALELAMRVNARQLSEAGLDAFTVDSWASTESDGGG